MQQCSFNNIPDSFLEKWQEIADLIASIISVPAALIMKTEDEFMEVFTSSRTENNPYNVGDRESWHGLYCKTVIKTQTKLNIPNALKDKNWDKNPDIKLGMIAYLGFPINFPDKTPFGTICVLDREERQFTTVQEKILLQFKNTIELDLALICALELEKNSDQSDVIKNLLQNNEEYQVINEEYHTTNEELQQANDELQQSKQRAEENEEKYRRIAENVTDVVWVTDLEMNPTYISPSVERIYGITPEEYLKCPLSQTYPLVSIEKFKKILAEQFAKERDPEADKNRTFQLEVERYYADGTLGWDVINATFIRDTEMNPIAIQGVSHDITERKKAEEKLRESEEMMRSSQAVAHVGSYSTKLNENAIEKSQWVCSPEFYRVFGIDESYPHTITGWAGFIHPDYRDEIFAYHASVVKEKKSFNREYKIIRINDGAERWVHGTGELVYNEQGKPIRMYGAIQDITDRKIIEQEMREKTSFLSTIMETSPVGIVTVGKTGNISYANNRAEQILGLKKDKITSTTYDNPLWEHTDLEGLPFPDEKQPFNIVKKTLNTVLNVQHGITWPDGTVKILSINAAPIKDSKGQFNGMIASIEDITEIKLAEKALHENIEKMHSIYRVAPTGIGVVVNRILKEVNPRVCEMTGYSREELVEKSARILYPTQEDYEFVGNEKYKQIRAKGTGEVETRWKRKNGAIINVFMASTPIDKNDFSKGVTFTALDITERKQKELQVTEQKDLLSAIYRNAPLLLMVVNAETRVQQINGFATHFVGKQAEEMLGLHGGEALRCLHVLDDPKGCGFGDFCQQCVIRNSILDTLKTGETHLQKEAPYFFKGDDDQIKEMTFLTSTSPIQMKGEPMVLVTLQDITERKMAETSLKESEERFKALHNASFGGITIHDKGIILECNQGLSEMTGYSIDELIGMDGLLLIAPETREMVMDKIVSGYEKPYEAIGMRKNGETFPMRLEARNIPYKGEIVRTVEFRDITERKKSEKLLQEHTEKIKAQNEDYESINEELRQTNEELYDAKEKAEESDRLKTAFLQNMSHEIRTPLNAISGFSGMLNKPKLKDEKRKKFVSIIQNSSQQLVAIITDILTISSLDTKQEQLNIERVRINGVIEELHAIFKSQAQKQNLTLKTKIPLTDSQSIIYTDKTKITQIFSNLLANALKFTQKGFVEIGYSLKTGNAAAEMEFYVKDSGIGMTPKQQKIIFERFQQAHKSINKLYGGTGLGLSISRGFVEMLGGRIWVQSTPNEGSTFYFTIPFKPGKETQKMTPLTVKSASSGTILVAEDEKMNFILIEEYLHGLGVKIIHAKDGQETVDICKRNSHIDLILMDIKMPNITGDEAAKIIKKQNPNLPIIAQSAYVQEHDMDRFSGIFDDYLAKPINVDRLKQTINKYINIPKN